MDREKVEALLDKVERHLQQQDGKTLPASQRAVLYSCLCNSNPPYKKMPDTLKTSGYGHYNWKTLKTDGYAVFKRLSNALGEEIKKTNCPRKLVDWYNRNQSDVHSSESDAQLSVQSGGRSAQSVLPEIASQCPPDLLPFQSWEPDLEDLSETIRQRHRVIFIGGVARIGKTYFSHALEQRIRPDFNTVVRCNLAEVKTLSRLCQKIRRYLPKDAINHSFGFSVSDGGRSNDASIIPELLEILQTHRILLIIDQTDACFSAQQLAGCFRPEFSSYEQLLKRLLNSPVGYGCLVWVGRQPPAFFTAQYGTLKAHQVKGLQKEDAAMLLQSRQISLIPAPKSSSNELLAFNTAGSSHPSANASYQSSGLDRPEADLDCLVKFCGGNPAWLLLEAKALERSRVPTIRRFIASPTLDRSLVAILDSVLEALKPTEYWLLCWLLLRPLSYPEIRQLESPDRSLAWEDAVSSLERRSLVQQDGNQQYCLNPPLLAYVLAPQLVQASVQALAALPDSLPDPRSVNTHAPWLQPLHAVPLFHGATSAEQQEWLHKNLRMDIADRFKQGLFQEQQIESLQASFRVVQENPVLRQGYTTSNLLNLATALKLPLSEFELRGLSIRHVDLRQANLYQADLTGCWFQQNLLPLNLSGPLTAAMTPQGDGIAVGDAKGSLFYWQRQATSFRLIAVTQIPFLESSEPLEQGSTAIEKVIFQDPHTVIVVSQQGLYSWWVDDPSPPRLLVSLPAPCSCVAQSSNGQIAVGLMNGSIVLWDQLRVSQSAYIERDRPQAFMAHRNAINHLAFSVDGYSLISTCEGTQGLIWDLRGWPHSSPSYQDWPLGPNGCEDIAWTQHGRLRAEASPMSTRITVRQEYGLGHRQMKTPLSALPRPDDSAMVFHSESDVISWELPTNQLIGLSFSQNADYLSGSSRTQSGDSLLFCWNWQTHTYREIQRPDCSGEVLATCVNGRLILVCQESQIQVFDLVQQELIWQVESPKREHKVKHQGRHRDSLTVDSSLETTITDTIEFDANWNDFITLDQVQGLSDVEVTQLQIAAKSSFCTRG